MGRAINEDRLVWFTGCGSAILCVLLGEFLSYITKAFLQSKTRLEATYAYLSV
jgi:hypothetical protein